MRLNWKRIIKSFPALMRRAGPYYRAKAIALSHMPLTGVVPPFSSRAHLDTNSFRSLAEFVEWTEANTERLAEWTHEDEKAEVQGSSVFSVPGYCAICDAPVDFVATSDFGQVDPLGQLRPNWREQLSCPGCHMSNRVRAAIHLAIQDFGLAVNSQIYITEQFGIAYRWLRGRFRNVQGSEYLSPLKASGFRRFGIMHQDIQALSFPTDSMDYILSFDVLEHVPDPGAAFVSFARVLRPGGRLIMTVPFTINKYETTVRAVMRDDGQIEHLLPIEIHGNPTDPVNGALCFRHFGWDVLGQLTSVGFEDAKVSVYHSRDLGYLGGSQRLISAVKTDR